MRTEMMARDRKMGTRQRMRDTRIRGDRSRERKRRRPYVVKRCGQTMSHVYGQSPLQKPGHLIRLPSRGNGGHFGLLPSR
ncbi:hypothetical protein RRG08_053271 [Elysia crispata]|uniref:Uncharacterized protein n=1 Tax=Elysia crispata TaxID=231223 RepID=A0AAE1E2Y7_9GAST|nr:hypothetical protein RRG08_053271 [Elysia crispata]